MRLPFAKERRGARSGGRVGNQGGQDGDEIPRNERRRALGQIGARLPAAALGKLRTHVLTHEPRLSHGITPV